MIKKLIVFVLVVCCFFSVPISSEAQDQHVSDCLEERNDCIEQTEAPEQNTNETDFTESNYKTSSLLFNIVKMAIALVLVLALIYVVLHFVKKRNQLFQQVGMLENVGGISLGQNKSIQIIRIGQKMYIVGVGDNVELLEEITDEATMETLQKKENTTFGAPSFVKNFFQGKHFNKAQRNEKNQQHNFTHTFQMELNKLKTDRNHLIDQYRKKDDEHV